MRPAEEAPRTQNGRVSGSRRVCGCAAQQTMCDSPEFLRLELQRPPGISRRRALLTGRYYTLEWPAQQSTARDHRCCRHEARGCLLRAEVFLTYAIPMHSAAVCILDTLEHMHMAGVGGVASASCLTPSDRRGKAPPKHLAEHVAHPAKIWERLEQCPPTARAAVPRQPLRACSAALGMLSAGVLVVSKRSGLMLACCPAWLCFPRRVGINAIRLGQESCDEVVAKSTPFGVQTLDRPYRTL